MSTSRVFSGRERGLPTGKSPKPRQGSSCVLLRVCDIRDSKRGSGSGCQNPHFSTWRVWWWPTPLEMPRDVSFSLVPDSGWRSVQEDGHDPTNLDGSGQPTFFLHSDILLDFHPSIKTHGHLPPPVVIHLLQEEQHLTVERMQPQISLSALAALVPMVLALPQQQPPPPGPPAACAPVNIIVARGSLEAQGAGLLGNIAMNASMQIPGSVITPLVYPAQLDPYPPSVSAGVMNMTTLLNQQAQQCPQSKLVLMGYSQVCVDREVDVMTLCLICCRAHKCRWIPSAVPQMALTSTRPLLRHPWSEARVSPSIFDAA